MATNDRSLLLALTRAHIAYHNRAGSEELFGALLDDLLSVTESRSGCIVETSNARHPAGENTLACSPDLNGLNSPTAATAVLETVLATGQTAFPDNATWYDGAIVCMPVRVDDDIVGAVMLGGREGGYDLEVVEMLEPALTSCGILFGGYERRRASLALQRQVREGKGRLAAILETAATAIVTIHQDGIIDSANPALGRMFGYDEGELIGANVSVLMNQPQRVEHDGYLRRYAEHGGAKIIGVGREVHGRRKDGTSFPVHLAVSELTIDGERLYTGILTDLSEQKRTEAELRRARDRAELADRAKSQFVATMSHEIRTPLNGIVGMVDLLAGTTLDEAQTDYVTTLQTSLDVLLSLVDEVLDLSKIEADQLVLEEIAFDPVTVVDRSIALFAAVAQQKQLRTERVVTDAAPGVVLGDANRIGQVVSNLIGNAVKFTDEGHVSVIVDGSMDSGRAELIITVTDSGPGIHAEQREAIFDTFVQADASTTRTHGGTGLGLAISRRLVEAMGGTLEVESEVGRGTVFRIVVPVRSSNVHLDVTGLDVLVAISSDEHRGSLVTVARSLGANVFPVKSWQAAGELLTGGFQFDAAIVGDDIQECHETAQHASGVAVRVLTSIQDDHDAAEVAECGYSALLTSPIERSTLLRVLATWSAPTPPTQSVSRGEQVKILIVDDDDINLRVLSAGLERSGHHVATAQNGFEALDRVVEWEPDVVLMDVRMPELDGIETTRLMRERHGDDLTIVIVTGDALETTARNALAAGADEVINKPVRPGSVAEIIGRHTTHPGGSMSQEDAIDLSGLAEYLEDEELARFLSDYRERLRTAAESTRSAAAAGDWITVRETAHKLRNVAAMIGADRVVETARTLDIDPLERGEYFFRRHTVPFVEALEGLYRRLGTHRDTVSAQG